METIILYAVAGWAAGSVVLFVVTWVLYLAIMNLRLARKIAKDLSGDIPSEARSLGTAVGLVGLVADWLLNWLVFTVLLAELPREFLVTTRLRRTVWHTGLRGRISRYFARNWINDYDWVNGPHVPLP